MSIVAAPSLTVGEAATLPAEQRGVRRDGVRLLVSERARGTHEHAWFAELPRFVRSGDLLVVNDSETLAAALHAQRADGSTLTIHFSGEVLGGLWLVEPRDPSGIGPLATIAAGERVALPGGGSMVFLAPFAPARPRVWYASAQIVLPLRAYLAEYGDPIQYRYLSERLPMSDYQTLFSRVPGSAEMPSAARPFTEAVVRNVRRVGASIATLTLHCGVSSAESFERPVPERFAVPAVTADLVNLTHERGGRVIAIGTTVVRALESAHCGGGVVAASGWTDRIVDRDRPVRTVDGLLTGFHEPAASHIAMLRQFLDDAMLERAYREARERGYLWHEFGDSHLILLS